MKDKIFGILQRVGRSFMLPIALLPAAGLLLGIGSSFTNATMLETYGLTRIIYPGSILYTILDIMSLCGNVVFSNLPLLFAMGVAIGMARQEKEVAALSGAIAYLIMNTAISAMIHASGGPGMLPANTTAEVLGITSLQTGVFGGIIVGLGVAALHNRFYQIQLPQVLSFFGGTRFVPIISTGVFLLVGVAMFYIWPIVQRGIAMLGQLVINTGYAGTWIYGIIERALIPFGLHHVFYMPFWQTAMGGTAVIDGAVIQGAQNIFFAELASRNTVEFSVSATRFMSGKFPFMIFGLPGAAYAMYRCAKPEKRRAVGSLLISAALTSMLTGITEPIEFTFLFVAPVMYVIHCIYAGLSYMLMHMLNVGVGMTFSGGLIDLTLFGILQGNAKTHWIWIIIVGAAYAVLYYFTFLFLIRRLDLRTPGREDEGEAKLYTRADYNARGNGDRTSALIAEGLGGAANIADIDACATRLRVTVHDPALVNDGLLKQSGASGVIRKGNGIQAIYGPQVSVIKSRLVEHMGQNNSSENTVEILGAHAAGTVINLSDTPDEAFSSGALGPGAAIIPSSGELYAPADGVIGTVFDTKHAITMTTASGTELLMHIGIDTVKLNGRFFETHTGPGTHVKKGDILISFNMDAISSEGFDLTIPLVICNADTDLHTEIMTDGKTSPKDDLIRLSRRRT